MDVLDRFIREDLGRRGDVTTKRLFGDEPIPARARIYPRERVVAAGVKETVEVFARFGVRTTNRAKEGSWILGGRPLLVVRGPLQGILSAERLALNVLGRMCGIATQTRRLADEVHKVNPRCQVAATRKTTPGFREFEKRAVVIGKGDPHRFGLFDAVLIKDNHLDAMGGDVTEAVRRARKGVPRLSVEVEVSDVEAAVLAAKAGADWILIDNCQPSEAAAIAAAARDVRPKVLIEVSGGLGPETLLAYAPIADRLSLGMLTHSVRSADVTLELVVPKR